MRERESEERNSSLSGREENHIGIYLSEQTGFFYLGLWGGGIREEEELLGYSSTSRRPTTRRRE